jgi:2-dehydropantoate 2-reductase
LALWKKFMLNVGVNQVAAAFHATYGDLNHNPHLQKLMKNATHEVWQIAQAMGIALTLDDWQHAVDPIKPLADDKAPSMQQDIQAKRATEVDSFAGEVMRLGKIYNIQTPVNETLYHLIRAQEYRYQTT